MTARPAAGVRTHESRCAAFALAAVVLLLAASCGRGDPPADRSSAARAAGPSQRVDDSVRAGHLREPVAQRLVLYIEAPGSAIEALRDSIAPEDFGVIADDLMFYRATAIEYLEKHDIAFVRLTGRRPIEFVVNGRVRSYDFADTQLLDFIILYETGREPRVIAPNEVELAGEMPKDSGR